MKRIIYTLLLLKGFFYYSEIIFLKRTFHSFSSNLIGYYYSVNYYGSKFN